MHEHIKDDVNMHINKIALNKILNAKHEIILQLYDEYNQHNIHHHIYIIKSEKKSNNS